MPIANKIDTTSITIKTTSTVKPNIRTKNVRDPEERKDRVKLREDSQDEDE